MRHNYGTSYTAKHRQHTCQLTSRESVLTKDRNHQSSILPQLPLHCSAGRRAKARFPRSRLPRIQNRDADDDAPMPMASRPNICRLHGRLVGRKTCWYTRSNSSARSSRRSNRRVRPVIAPAENHHLRPALLVPTSPTPNQVPVPPPSRPFR